MTDQPRLTDAARAAIEATGKPGEVTDLPPLYDTRKSEDYRRGWNDFRDLVLKMLGAPR